MQDPGDWEADMVDGKLMYYKTKAEAEKRMGDLKAEGKFGGYRVVPHTTSGGGNYWTVQVKKKSAEEESEWKPDTEGDKAMYYKTKAEAEKRMGDLKEADGTKQYRVRPYTNRLGSWFRVEIKSGGGTTVAAGTWVEDFDGGAQMYYKTKGEAETRRDKLKAMGTYDEFKIVRVTKSTGKFWGVQMRKSGSTGASSTTTTTTKPEVTTPEKTTTTTPEVTKPETTTTTKPESTTTTTTDKPEATTTTNSENAATTGTTTAPATTSTGKAAYKLGLSGAVGIDQANAKADVELVRAKLVAYGFLASDKKDQASINAAIKKFQKDVLGMKKPDGVISAGGGTERALTTYYTAAPSDYSTIKKAQEDITVKTTSAPSSFSTAMSGATINSSSTADNVDIPALIAVEDRMKQLSSRYLGKSFSNTKLKALKDKKNADLKEDEKKTVKSHISAVVKGLKKMQEGKGSLRINDWANRKQKGSKTIYMLTGTTTKPAYKKGQIADGDATFLLMKKKSQYAITFEEGGKDVTRRTSDYVSSGYTVNPDGVGYSGVHKPTDMSLDTFKETGLTETQSKALKHASKHEGKFDAINGYDRALMSFGFIQFAGGGRSLEYLFARIKSEHPSVWQDNFAKYGIDVEYKTNAKGTITENSCRIVVHDVDNKKTVRGDDATVLLANDKELTGVLMRAGGNSTVQKMQVAVAKEKYVDPANASKLNEYKMTVLVVKNAKGEQTDVKVDLKRKGLKNRKWETKKAEIAAYKKTQAYKTANTAGLVSEVKLDDVLAKLTLGAIMKSEKEQAALVGTYLNSPKYARYAFGDAIVEIIEEKGLTTASQIKAIGVDELLKKAESKSQHKLHPKRIKEAREAKDLKG